MMTTGEGKQLGRLIALALPVVLCAGIAEAESTPSEPAAAEEQVEKQISAAQLQRGVFLDARFGGQLALSDFGASGFRLEMDFGYQFQIGLGLVLHMAMGMFPEGAYDDFRDLESYYDMNEDRLADYFELQGGLRHSWLFARERVRLTGQGAYGSIVDVLAGSGHGLNLLSQLDFRVLSNVDTGGSMWLGLSAGATVAFLEAGQANSASFAFTMQVHL